MSERIGPAEYLQGAGGAKIPVPQIPDYDLDNIAGMAMRFIPHLKGPLSMSPEEIAAAQQRLAAEREEEYQSHLSTLFTQEELANCQDDQD